jgi:hypothetical protein
METIYVFGLKNRCKVQGERLKVRSGERSWEKRLAARKILKSTRNYVICYKDYFDKYSECSRMLKGLEKSLLKWRSER